jgi:hypothetical protein
MYMKAAGEDRHVEMEADYTPAADILTSCRNNSNVRANAWVDDLTGRFQRELKGCFTNTPRIKSCSVWQQRTAHDTPCDDDGGWKETSGAIVASEADESNPVKTPTSEPYSRHSDADNLKACGRRGQPQHLFVQGRCPVYPQDTSFCFLSRTRLKLRGRHDRRTMDVLLINQITRVVIC